MPLATLRLIPAPKNHLRRTASQPVAVILEKAWANVSPPICEKFKVIQSDSKQFKPKKIKNPPLQNEHGQKEPVNMESGKPQVARPCRQEVEKS
jgi:hypothetical protein